MVDVGFDEEVELNIDWDHLLGHISDDLSFDFCDLSAGDGLPTSPNPACPLSIDDIEQYLMADDESKIPEEIDQDIVAEGLFSDLLLDSSPGSGSGSWSDRSKDSTASPGSEVEVETDEEAKDKEKEKPHESPFRPKKSSVVDVVDDDDDDDSNDPLAKKRKRQMRNRDAAVRSRERKKTYVRDLEMKSRYFEAECKRLGHMLQCCIAENQALRLSMLNNSTNKAFDVSMTKQESAVLFLESLLLGSLLWFLGILYLLILPGNLLSTLDAGLLENEGSGELVPRRAENKVRRVALCSLMLGKSCKGSRSRMKLKFCLPHCTSDFATSPFCQCCVTASSPSPASLFVI